MKNFLKLIRVENLVMIALMQIIVRYTFLNFAGLIHGFSDLNYALLIIATICIAAVQNHPYYKVQVKHYVGKHCHQVKYSKEVV